jgi:hypothetical protein
VTLGTISGSLLLKGGRIGAKRGAADSTAVDVGLDAASALAFESFIRDSAQRPVLSRPGSHGKAVVTSGRMTFVMEQGSGAVGSDSSSTTLNAAAIDAILSDDDNE